MKDTNISLGIGKSAFPFNNEIFLVGCHPLSSGNVTTGVILEKIAK